MKLKDLTTEFLRDNYLFGIPLQDISGNQMKEELLQHYINSAIQYAQRAFQIVIEPTEFIETHDYYSSDFTSWSFLHLFKKPILSVKDLGMYFGSTKMFNIPIDWISLYPLAGQIQLFPTSGSSGSMILTQNGSFRPALIGMYSNAPNIWRIEYVAGMEEIPDDLAEFIMKRASIGILQVWGDLIIGAGIANETVSIDGLSQSIGTTQSPEFSGSGARIKNYIDDLKDLEKRLRDTYLGINLGIV